MQYISDFADAAVVMPLVLALLAVGAWLRRGAVLGFWAGCVGLVWAAMLCLKAACFALDAGETTGIASPSGHTASACIVYGGLAWLLWHHDRPVLAWTVPVVVTGLVGVSRVVAGAHQAGEVVVGALVGAAGLALLRHGAGAVADVRAGPMLLVTLAVVAMLHGASLPVEMALHALVVGR